MTRLLPLLLCLTACVAPPPRIGLAPEEEAIADLLEQLEEDA